MKKIVSLLICFGLTLFIAGCTNDSGGDNNGEDPVYYTVKFNSNGGSKVNDQTIEKGLKVDEPSDPLKSGFDFGGWFEDEDLSGQPYDFDTEVLSDFTLYAKWNEVQVPGLSNEEKLELDLEALELESPLVISKNLALPTRGSNGTTFKWVSSDLTALTNTGIALPSPIGGEAKEVTLTLTAKNGSVSRPIDYEVTVPAKVESVITSKKSLSFNNLTPEYTVSDGELMTYFVDEGTVPYVNLEDFLDLLNGFIYSDEIEYVYSSVTEQLTLSYMITYTNGTEDPSDDEDVTYECIVDFDKNSVYVETDSFFSAYVHSTETDYSSKITYLDEVYYEEGDPITYDLNAYRFDLIYDEGAYVIPLHAANLLFCGGSYFNVYFNGDNYKGIYAYGDDPLDFRESSLNGKQSSLDMKLASMDFFAFTLDYFYGLKVEKEVDTYYDHIYPKVGSFLGTTNLAVSNAYSDFVLKVLDERHSAYIYSSFYSSARGNTPTISLESLGPDYLDYYNTYQTIRTAYNTRFPSGAPSYRFADGTNTAIIYLDEFVTKGVEDPDTIVDSDVYMEETIAAIFAENPNTDSIVVDISYNGGGNIGALFRVLGYITDNPIATHSQNPLTGERQTYWAEIETEAVNVNWFFLTSKVTFSAANLMAAIGKYQGVATIIGQQSGGGACSILPIYLPDGSCYQISSLNLLSYRVGSDEEGWEYISVESGVKPDYSLPIGSLYYDKGIAELVAAINSGTATPLA